MIRGPVLCVAVVSFVFLSSCNRVADPSTAVEHPVARELSVSFDLEPGPSSGGAAQWIGTYNAQGKLALFRLDFGPGESVPGKTAGPPAVKSGEGTLFPEPGSDASVLL